MVLSKAKVIGFGLVAVGIVTMITLGYFHYTGLVADNARLEADNAKLLLAAEVNEGTISAQASALTEWELKADELEVDLIQQSAARSRAESEVRRLNGIFAEHDLTRLAIAKPGLIERRINSGTARIGRLLECASDPECNANGDTADP